MPASSSGGENEDASDDLGILAVVNGGSASSLSSSSNRLGIELDFPLVLHESQERLLLMHHFEELAERAQEARIHPLQRTIKVVARHGSGGGDRIDHVIDDQFQLRIGESVGLIRLLEHETDRATHDIRDQHIGTGLQRHRPTPPQLADLLDSKLLGDEILKDRDGSTCKGRLNATRANHGPT